MSHDEDRLASFIVGSTAAPRMSSINQEFARGPPDPTARDKAAAWHGDGLYSSRVNAGESECCNRAPLALPQSTHKQRC
jgi:hypothetical protein